MKDLMFLLNTSVDDLKKTGATPLVHGNGFMQLSLNKDRSHRLHIWHPNMHGQNVSTQIHNHTFGFESEVMYGGIINNVFDVIHSDDVTEAMHICEAESVPGSEDTILVKIPDGLVDVQLKYTKYITVGKKYYFPPFEYHETIPVGFSATVMRKTITTSGYKARVLCDVDKEPDNDFSRYSLKEDGLWAIVDELLQSLKSKYNLP